MESSGIVRETLSIARATLAAVSETPHLDAAILLAHTLQQPRSYLYAWPECKLTSAELDTFTSLIERRYQREPIAYLTGHKEFWTLDLMVTADTLIPRPETEILIETVLHRLPKTSCIQLADLGTGSGAIALALAHERPQWQIYATDISAAAIKIASNNAHHLGLNNISFTIGNWCTALPVSKLEVIVSNPPYIAEEEWQDYAAGLNFEPRQALVSGEDGLKDIREICTAAINYLQPKGYLLLEHGYNQAQAVREIFAAKGYKNIDSVRDLAGHERVTVGQHLP